MYSMYMYKKDLALNNQQGLICHKTQPIHSCIGLCKNFFFIKK